ncbi:MAG: 3-dehydroquinate synthase [Bacteroidaceae bacterium]|nr:3-dehydroquinate synthase [Bacteroidaceae bacterium]
MIYKTIHVEASRSYDIIIGRDILPQIAGSIRPLTGDCRLCILTDSTVDALYGDKLVDLLTDAGFAADKFVIPAGEASKCADNLLDFLNFLAECKYTRSDALIAFGGGVVGDLCGLSAALYLRGVKYIQIPTTLLAAVDSSVGGKTAIDIPAGKNLVGAFYQPVLVYCDTALMDTLSPEIYRDGCAEVIKYGVILDKQLYEILQRQPFEREYVVSRCVEIKRDVVQQDEFDNGLRGLLNFGHTFGHAVEKLSDFAVSHGAAVAKGMLLAARMAPLCGLCNVADELVELLHQYGFDLSVDYSADEIYEAILSDKKRRGGDITVVLPRAIGNCTLVTLPVERLYELLKQILTEDYEYKA